jgi:hypothetical protein
MPRAEAGRGRARKRTGDGGQSLGRLALELATVSFVVLFRSYADPLASRPGPVVAYFPNLVLLSAFLGLGLGCLRAGRLAYVAWRSPSSPW